MRGARSWAGDGGFALIEALASLVIVAMISLMLVQGLATGRRVWERIDANGAAGESIEGAQSLLRDRIEQLYPATLYDAPTPYADIDGDGGELGFLSAPPSALGPAPLRRYHLILTPAGDLRLQWTSSAQPGQGAVSQTLLRGVRRMEIAYFGADPADPSPGWRHVWRHEPTPPGAVRIRLNFAPGDRRQWPDLIIRPQATVDSDCSFSPTTGRCGGGV